MTYEEGGDGIIEKHTEDSLMTESFPLGFGMQRSYAVANPSQSRRGTDLLKLSSPCGARDFGPDLFQKITL